MITRNIPYFYEGSAWGRRRLKDWTKMPILMKAGFVSVDSPKSHIAWHSLNWLLLFSVLLTAGKIFYDWPDILLSDNALTGSLDLLALCIVIVAISPYLIRCSVTIWYEQWRKKLKI